MSELEREIAQRSSQLTVDAQQNARVADLGKVMTAVPLQFAQSPDKEVEQSEQTTAALEERQVGSPVNPPNNPVVDAVEATKPAVQLKSAAGMPSVPPVPLKSSIAAVSGFSAPTFQFKSASIEEAMDEQSTDDGKIKADPTGAPNNTFTNTNGLPVAVQAKMEGAMGADFSNVNIHKESHSATEVGALAYAQGNDVHFAPGHYNPESTAGQELIGHELAHVVQQRQGRVQATTQAKGLPVNDDKGLEAEADAMGQKAAQMKVGQGNANSDTSNTTMMNPSASTIQRWEWPWNWGGGGSSDKDKKEDDKKDLKKVKQAGKTAGTNFDTNVAIPGALPAMGTMMVTLRMNLNFQDCDFEYIKSNILSTDTDSLKNWKKQFDLLKANDPVKLKWTDKEKDKAKKDYQKNIDDVWSSTSSNLTFKLDEKEYEKYQVTNNFKLEFTDKNPHHGFTVVKMPDEMGPDKLRSYMGGATGGFHDSRTFGGNSKRTLAKNYLTEQVGEFDNGSAAVNPAISGKLDTFAAEVTKIIEAHKGDTPAPKWNLGIIGRATSSGSTASNTKISQKRADNVKGQLLSKVSKDVSMVSQADPQGNTKTDDSSKYRRVELIFRDANTREVEQTTMAHETGHLFGYGDEYPDTATDGVLPKFNGDEADDTSKAIRDAGMGEDIVKQHRINQNKDSIMNAGNVVGVGHYSLFLIELKKISTDFDSGAQVNWQVIKG